MDKNIQSMLNYKLDGNLSIPQTAYQMNLDYPNSGGAVDAQNCYTGWGFWQDFYYPQVITNTYPVYIQERAKDKGKQAYEIIKILKDKKCIKLEKVGDFIDLMDELIKIL